MEEAAVDAVDAVLPCCCILASRRFLASSNNCCTCRIRKVKIAHQLKRLDPLWGDVFRTLDALPALPPSEAGAGSVDGTRTLLGVGTAAGATALAAGSAVPLLEMVVGAGLTAIFACISSRLKR